MHLWRCPLPRRLARGQRGSPAQVQAAAPPAPPPPPSATTTATYPYPNPAAPVVEPRKGSKFLPYEQAHLVAKALRLKKALEWFSWCASGARPSNVPAHPEKVGPRPPLHMCAGSRHSVRPSVAVCASVCVCVCVCVSGLSVRACGHMCMCANVWVCRPPRFTNFVGGKGGAHGWAPTTSKVARNGPICRASRRAWWPRPFG